MKRFSNRPFLTVVLVLTLVLGVSAISLAKSVTVNLVMWGQDSEIASMKEIVANFEAENPDIDVKFEQIPHNQYDELLDTRIAGGRAPDVFRQVYGSFGRYIEAGAALDLTSRISPQMKAEFPDIFWMSATDNKGHIYALPHITDTIATFYNVQYAKNAGLAVPTRLEDSWTLDEFVQAGKKIQEANHLDYAFSSYTRHPKSWGSLLYAMGASIMNEAQTESAFNEPAAVRAIQWTVDTVKDGLTPSSVVWKRVDSNDQVFSLGKIGLNISGQWMLPYFDENMTNWDFDVTYMPRDKNMSSDFGGGGFMISKSTRHADAAWQLASYISGEKSMLKFSQDGAFIPARRKLQETIEYPKFNDMLKVFVQQNSTVQLRMIKERANPKYSAMEKIYAEEIELAVLGQKTVQEAADAIVKRINRLLK